MNKSLITALLMTLFAAMASAQTSPPAAPAQAPAPAQPAAPAPAPAAAPSADAAAPAKTPLEVMTASLEEARPKTKLVLNSFKGLGIDAATLAKFLGDEEPSGACDLKAWASHVPSGVMPILWDDSSKLYKASQEAWSAASPAIQRFTWYYLRAYSALQPDLRATHSAVAVGLAANIAAEVVYPENLAVLPDDVVGPASIVMTLHLVDPEFFVKARTSGIGAATTAVSAAFGKLCAVGLSHEFQDIHKDPAALVRMAWDRAVEGKAVTLAQIIPGHPTSQQRLAEQAAKLSNLTLRATIEAAVCITRYSLLPNAEARERWQEQLNNTLKSLTAETGARRAAHLAPLYDKAGGEFTSGDYTALRPLAVMVGASQGKELFAAYADKGIEGARELLVGSPAYKQMCQLAGQEPELLLMPKPEVRAESVVLGNMTFRHLVRMAEEQGAPLSEKLTVELIAIIPSGDADPIRGFDAQAFVCVKDQGSDTPRWVRGDEVITGMKVLSHMPLGDPQTGATVLLPSKVPGAPPSTVRPTFCTVTEVRIRDQVKGTMTLNFQKGWSVVVALPEHVLVNAAATGVWVRSTSLDAGVFSWAGESRPVDELKTNIIDHKTPRKLVDLALTHEEDDLAPMAHNCVIARAGSDSSEAMTVECRSGDTSLVAEDEELATTTGRVPLKNVVVNPNPDREAPKDATVVSAWWERPQSAVWPYPQFTPGEAWIAQKESVRLTQAIKLQLKESDGAIRPFLCSGDTKLLLTNEKGEVTRRRARNAKKGELLVAGFAEDGKTPQTVEVADDIEQVEMPKQNFVALSLTNLRIAKAGPVLVEWNSEQFHTFNIGVATDTKLALASPSDAAAPAPSADADGATPQPAFFKVADSAPISDTAGRPLAVYDPALNVIAAGRLGQAIQFTLSRQLVIKAGGQQLVVAGSQALLVAHANAAASDNAGPPERDVVLAYQLKPEDSIYFATKNDTKARPVKVESVQPTFKVAAPMAELISASAETWHKNLAASSDTCLANSLAVVMAAPRGVRTKIASIKDPGTEQAGPGAGTFKGNNAGTSARLQEVDSGAIPKLAVDSPERLDLPPMAVQQLKDRALLIKRQFEGERGQLKAVPRSGMPARLESGLKPGKWPFNVDGAQLGNELNGWVTQALQRRAAFLEAPTLSDIPDLCLQDIVLASWLSAAGARESANLFARDAVDFGLYAGFSKQSMKDFKMPGRLGLGQVLAASKSAAPGSGDSSSYSVTPHVSSVIKSWAESLKAIKNTTKVEIPVEAPVPKAGIVELDEVFALWGMLGELNDIEWPSTVGKDFDSWLDAHKPTTQEKAR
ncbi:hypothetical protein [Prosthecobacter sp.]|uniref:hypothetical protein n=1 Tax=Prosthecobacter sp. TaxID=1965333 RepID=UPI003782E07D